MIVQLEITSDILFALGLCLILFVRHLLDGVGAVCCLDEFCIIQLFFEVTLFACYFYERQFVKIARKTDDSKEYPPKNEVFGVARKGRALQKSIAEVDTIIKGLING